MYDKVSKGCDYQERIERSKEYGMRLPMDDEEKSGLYRLFHKRLSVKRAASMTTEEVNNLYGGIEEAKGMSR